MKSMVEKLILQSDPLRLFSYLLGITNRAQGSIFFWDSSQKKLLTNSDENLKSFRLYCYLAWPFVTGVTLQLLFSEKDISHSLLFQSTLFTIVFIASFYIQLSLLKWRNEIASHINALIEFEERHYGSHTVVRDLIRCTGEINLLLSLLSSPVLSLAYGGMIYMQPCIPCNLGYLLIPECHAQGFSLFSTKTFDDITKFLLFFFNILMSRFFFSGFILNCAGFGIVQCLFLRTACIFLKSLFVGLRSLEQRAGTRTVLLFRQIQILEVVFNNFHRYNVQIELFTMTITLPISLYALIKVELNLAQELFFALAVLDSPIVIIGCFGVVAEVHKSCVSLLKGANADLTIQRDKYLKRHIRSWPVLKVKFGSANYVDKLTPVKSLDLSLNTTASLLLLH